MISPSSLGWDAKTGLKDRAPLGLGYINKQNRQDPWPSEVYIFRGRGERERRQTYQVSQLYNTLEGDT